jgi:hypothetical protein
MGGGFHFNNVDSLKYATNASGNWVTTTIDNINVAIENTNNLSFNAYRYWHQVSRC